MSEEPESNIVVETQPDTEKPPRRRRPLWMAGLGVLVVVLIGAAFLAGRLLNAKNGPVGSSMITDLGGGMTTQSIEIEMGEPPEELPRTAPDVNGMFAKRSDNVITVGTNPDGGMVIAMDASGTVSSPPPSGPQVEVVVTKDTKVYRDSTLDDLKGGLPDFSQKIQQKVTEAGLDEIGNMSFITAWGRKSGDRIIADVLLFSSPMVFQKSE